MACYENIIEAALVCLDMRETNGQELIRTLVREAVNTGVLPPEHKEAALRAVLNREQSASTAIPDGIALPHGRCDAIDEIICMFGVHSSGLEFGAPDNRPTHIFVLLLVPTNTACNHIHFLARLSRCLIEPSVRADLMAATTRAEFIRIILNYADKRVSQ